MLEKLLKSDTDQREQERVRKARYRALLKDGGGVLRVPVADINATIGMMTDLNWLPLSESEDRKKAGEAAGRLLDDLTRATKRE